MARRPPQPEPTEPVFTPEHIEKAIARFHRRLAELDTFNPDEISDRSDPRFGALEVAIEEALAEAFGRDTRNYENYSVAARLDTASVNLISPTPLSEIVEGLRRGKARSIALLQQAISSLEEKLAEMPSPQGAERPKNLPPSNEVFIIHGHDDAKIEVARLIERAGLNAVILHEQPNQGRTIAEKLEHHGGAAGFAVAILTPDDWGGPDKDNLQPRARQNVVGELFWFAGKLGRSRVCALMKGKVEIPSDFAGVAYTDMDDRGAWKGELLRELTAAGYDVNWTKAMA